MITHTVRRLESSDEAFSILTAIEGFDTRCGEIDLGGGSVTRATLLQIGSGYGLRLEDAKIVILIHVQSTTVSTLEVSGDVSEDDLNVLATAIEARLM